MTDQTTPTPPTVDVDPLAEAIEAVKRVCLDDGWVTESDVERVVRAAAPIIAAQARAEVEQYPLRVVEACSCIAWPPEGPSPECAVHGAVRALNEVRAQLAEVTRERDEARAAFEQWLETAHRYEMLIAELRAGLAAAERDALLRAADLAAGGDWAWLRIDTAHWLRHLATNGFPNA